MSPADKQLIIAYLDGRQSPEEAVALEARIAVEPGLARRWAELLLIDIELHSALAFAAVAAPHRRASSFLRNQMAPVALIAATLMAGLGIWAWASLRGQSVGVRMEVPDVSVGDVKVDGSVEWQSPLRYGQTVSTRVPLTLRWQNEATSVVVTPFMDQAIVRLTERGLVLEVGILDAEVAPRDLRHAFTVVSADAVATVVGTHFRITRSAKETALQVMKGRVEFSQQGHVQMVDSGGSAGSEGLLNEGDLSQGLIARWSGSSLVGNRLEDLVTGGQVGEARGVATVSGHHGQALHFSGEGSLAAIPHATRCDLGDPTQPFTIAGWLRLEKNDRRDQTILGKGRNLNTPGPTLAVVLEVSAGDHLDLYRWHDAEPHADRKMEVSGWTVPHLADGAWHHVVVVAEHASLRRCYYDGMEVGTDTRTWLHDTRNLSRWTIGRLENMGFTEEYPFTGDLEDLRLYNRAVTSAEVTRLFSWR